MDDSPGRVFRSALVAAAREADTLPLVRALHSDGFAVLERPAFDATFQLARSREFDIVFWQIHTPSPAEVEFLNRLQRARVPVIALVADGDSRLMGVCLESGADACLQLAADAAVVVAQVHAVLRRWSPEESPDIPVNGTLQVGDIRVDTDRCEVDRAGCFIPLTATEFRIIEFMARNAGRVLRPHEILNAVSEDYQYHAREAQEVFKVYVRRIRRKLEPSADESRYLVNVRGFGYRLDGGRPQRDSGQQAGTG
jgi:DNA-binding response OmpR family regulator